MPRGIPFKSDEERLEANRKRQREWQRKNTEKTKIYRNKEEVKKRIKERDRKYKAKRRKDPAFKEREKIIGKKSYIKNKNKIRARINERYKTDEEFNLKARAHHTKWYKNNKEKLKEKWKEKWAADPIYRSKINQRNKVWQEKNQEHMIEQRKKSRPRAAKYEREKTKNDPIYRMAKSLRARMRGLIKRNLKAGIEITKTATTQKNLGCSFKKFKKYMESKWSPNMSWKNYGSRGWHIDHIIPAGIIDLTLRENEQFVCNYKNLQPLWAKDNLKKNSNIEKKFPLNTSEEIINNWIVALKKKLRKDFKFKFNRFSDQEYKIIEVYPKFFD